ncbi:MAG: hypothetical protein MOGDAGHF_02873 [Rhodocyclaceae bacterium]|nr:hypothetical protein [Rhodocyclaceae bacterium]
MAVARCQPAAGATGAARSVLRSQNRRLPLRASEAMTRKPASSSTVHTIVAAGVPRNASSSISLPMKPEKGGSPAAVTAATRKPSASHGAAGAGPGWKASDASPRRSAMRSASRKKAAPARVDWTR